MLQLIVAEKPDVAKLFAAALGAKWNADHKAYQNNTYRITFLNGHVLALKGLREMYESFQGTWDTSVLSGLPVFPDLTHKSVYKVTKKGFFETACRNLIASDVDRVINACDPGREGDLLFWEVYANSGSTKPVVRFWESEYPTKEVVHRGLSNLKGPDFYEPRRSAAYARQQADWYVGMNLTVAYIAMSGRKYTVGPVQTPVLALVVTTDEIIESWPHVPYSEIEAYFQGFSAKFRFEAPKFSDYPYSLDPDHAMELMEYFLKCDGGVVKSVQRDGERVAPPKLYSLTTLQSDANRKYGFSASSTLKIAQKLYEQHVLSYPRTDSKVIGDSMLDKANGIAQALGAHYQIDYGELNFTKANVNNKELTDHHAILPLEPLPSDASESERKLYNLVLYRFFQAFGTPGIDNRVKVEITVGEGIFEARGRVRAEDGWRKYQSPDKASATEEGIDDQIPALFSIREKQSLRFVKPPQILHKKLAPPNRYTQATLLEAMDNIANGIEDKQTRDAVKAVKGRLSTPATQDALIDLLLDRGYIEEKRKALISTPLGRSLIKTVSPELKDTFRRATMEQLLNDFDNPHAAKEYLDDVKDLVKRNIAYCRSTKPADITYPGIGISCPACHAELQQRPKSFRCSNVSCSFSLPTMYNGYSLKQADIKDLVTTGQTKVRSFKKKDTNKPYTAKLILKDGTLSLSFPTREDMKIAPCPKCKEGFVYSKTPSVCICTKCDFTLYREIAKVRLSDAQLRKLIIDNNLQNVKGFKKANGETFIAGLTFDSNWKVKFTKALQERRKQS